jgi:hypothetical protein
MGWLAKAVSYLAGQTIAQMVQVRLQEAIPVAGGIDNDEHLYRRLTGQSRRDLPPVKHSRMLEIAHYLAQTNPFAQWLLNTTRDFLCGEGLTITATDPRIQEVIDAFWDDPINRMALTWPEMVRELALFGEQCWPIFINEHTGLMRLASVDPSAIREVVHDPDNAREPIGIILRDSAGQPGKKLRILKGGEDSELFAPAALRLRQETFIDGDCFYYAINKASSSETRGISDLFALADWLDGYEQLLWNGMERTGFLNAFAWDITLEGMDQAEIDEWKRKNPPPKPGSVFAHNHKVTMQAVSPDLHASDADIQARLVRNQILGAAGFPEHWYGGGGDVNRATAAEMSAPTIKGLQARQRFVKHMLHDVLTMQLREAQARQQSLRGLDTTFEVEFPRIDAGDLRQAAMSLKDIAAAALIAETNGWITKDQATRLFAAGAALAGSEIDLAEIPGTDAPDYEDVRFE